MNKLISATRGWKRLQKEYREQDILGARTQKLCAVLEEDLSGGSAEEAVIHYNALSFFSLDCGVAAYMQAAGTREQTAAWFSLASLARRTVCGLMKSSPRRTFGSPVRLQLDLITAAVLCGEIQAALETLEVTRLGLTGENPPAEHGSRPRSRTDQRQEQERRRRLALEIDLYERVLQGEDEKALLALRGLEERRSDSPEQQVLCALLEGDGAAFRDALSGHMRAFRSTPDPEPLNWFVLLAEAVYQMLGGEVSLDLADAPSALLCLPACDPAEIGERLGLSMPEFDVDVLRSRIDWEKIGPKFKQY